MYILYLNSLLKDEGTFLLTFDWLIYNFLELILKQFSVHVLLNIVLWSPLAGYETNEEPKSMPIYGVLVVSWCTPLTPPKWKKEITNNGG